MKTESERDDRASDVAKATAYDLQEVASRWVPDLRKQGLDDLAN